MAPGCVPAARKSLDPFHATRTPQPRVTAHPIGLALFSFVHGRIAIQRAGVLSISETMRADSSLLGIPMRVYRQKTFAKIDGG